MAPFSNTVTSSRFFSRFLPSKGVFFKVLMVGLAIILPSGCFSSHHTGEKYYQDGRHKPVVALFPVADHTNQPFGWDASSHLTHLFQNAIEDQTPFHIPPREHLKQLIGRVNSKDLFTSPETVAKQFFPGHDYLVAMELLEQHIEKLPEYEENKLLHTSRGNILLTGRVLVISFYQGNTRVILQEAINIKQPIHLMDENIDYHKIGPDDALFEKAPLELAYKRLAKEVAQRVKHYVGLERGGS
jgi:hypothetical protein